MKREPLVLVFALLFPSFMAWLYFVVASPPPGSVEHANAWLQTLYALGKVVQFGTPLAWLVITKQLRPAMTSAPLENDLAKPSQDRLYGIQVGIIFGVAAAAIAYLIYIWDRPRQDLLQPDNLFFGAPEKIRTKLREFGAFTPLRYAALVTFLSVINSFLEEYYWRWFVFGRLKKYVPLAAAIVISSLGFMGHHVIVLNVYFTGRFWSAVVPFSLAIAFGGAVWAWIYHKSGSLIGPWISHLIVDVAVMTIGYDLAFRQ